MVTFHSDAERIAYTRGAAAAAATFSKSLTSCPNDSYLALIDAVAKRRKRNGPARLYESGAVSHFPGTLVERAASGPVGTRALDFSRACWRWRSRRGAGEFALLLLGLLLWANFGIFRLDLTVMIKWNVCQYKYKHRYLKYI